MMFKRKVGGSKVFGTMLKKTALFLRVGFPNSHQELFCSTPFWFFSFSPFPVLPPCPKCSNRKHNKYGLCFPPGCDQMGRTIEHHCLTMLRLLLFNSSHISLHKKSVEEEFFVLSNSCKCSLRGGVAQEKTTGRKSDCVYAFFKLW